MAGEKLLIVDDDTTLLRFLTDYLVQEGFVVQSADRGQAALRLFYEARPDLVVLDVMMPGMDGWEVCARLRELSETPVILLTAKTSEADKLRGFRLGVDDYITKPFSLAELRARVRAVLSRTSGQRAEQGSVLEVGSLRVDLGRREATLEGRPLDLTPTEFRLLAALAAKPGQALSQAQLVEEAWGAYRQEAGSALRRYIWFLRQKIESDPEKPTRLLTVRGYGYRLEP
ncbi:MAG: response regulator transcription factor [Chloroflexi bacterium]|jgi:DNA-binding response OmpR family regulator|nr:response regulator transcription factor [Chloroflexota bacterium]